MKKEKDNDASFDEISFNINLEAAMSFSRQRTLTWICCTLDFFLLRVYFLYIIVFACFFFLHKLQNSRIRFSVYCRFNISRGVLSSELFPPMNSSLNLLHTWFFLLRVYFLYIYIAVFVCFSNSCQCLSLGLCSIQTLIFNNKQ